MTLNGNGRTRDLTATGLWALAALGWTLALFLPWTGRGAAASISPLDAGHLLAAGVGGVPAWTASGLLVVPLLAGVLVAIAPLRGPWVLAVRLVLWLVLAGGTLALLAFLHVNTAGQLGAGGFALIAAALAGLVALGFGTVRRPAATAPGAATVPA